MYKQNLVEILSSLQAGVIVYTFTYSSGHLLSFLVPLQYSLNTR